MPTIARALAVGALGAALVDCAPPPPPLTGSVRYTWDCEQEMGASPETTHPFCPPTGVVTQGTDGPPTRIVGCGIRRMDNGRVQLRFRIGDGGQTCSDARNCLSLCGEVAGPNQMMSSGKVDIFVTGSNAQSQGVPTTCQVRIGEITTNGFRGQLQCTDARDNQIPYRKLRIRGIAAGANRTAEGDWADFDFSGCIDVTSNCP